MKDLLDYNSDTGKFYWVKPRKKKNVGVEAGGKDFKGYIKINIKGKKFSAHRLAWFFTYNEWPADQIDHVNNDKSDNRIGNLRVVSNRQNSQNRKRHKLGHLVGAKQIPNGTWCASIEIKGRSIHLGVFKTEIEAHLRYLEELDDSVTGTS